MPSNTRLKLSAAVPSQSGCGHELRGDRLPIKVDLAPVFAAAILLSVSCKAYRMPSTSMEPTLLPGDYFTTTSSVAAPVRKEIVVYGAGGQVLIKRVLGLPGDTLAMRAGVLLVNGHSLAEPYALHDGEQSQTDPSFAWQRRFLLPSVDSLRYHPTITFWGPIVVPSAKYFVLGDNRGESADSRYFGFVDRSEIFARPRFIYFSKEPHTWKIRWNRIGRPINDST